MNRESEPIRMNHNDTWWLGGSSVQLAYPIHHHVGKQGKSSLLFLEHIKSPQHDICVQLWRCGGRNPPNPQFPTYPKIDAQCPFSTARERGLRQWLVRERTEWTATWD